MSNHTNLRRVILPVVGCFILVSAYMVRASNPQPAEQVKLAVNCQQGARSEDLPTSRYFFSEEYGWFDSTHFNAGNPGQVIADVRKTVRAGGGIGIITIDQKVHNGVAGYSASYYLSPKISEKDELGVALGIYSDWSFRFEAWQAQLPQTLVGLLSPFAVEDLPSHYVGFFAQAHDMEVYEVFACYLPDTGETEESPPRFTTHREVTDNAEEPLNYPERLANREMLPMVHGEEAGWEHVLWPPEMQMEMVDTSSGLWDLEDEASWYMGEDQEP